MILRPDFYVPDNSDPLALRAEMSLQPTLPTAIVLFGGHGSKVMFDITERLDAAGLPVQLILICGRNEALAAKFRARKWCMPVNVIGFTKEIHKWMRAADFLIGKPGPGSIAEAMVRKLPVLIECNSWTLPQERFNAEWVLEKRVGIVLKNFKEIAEGVRQMLEPTTFAEFRKNVAAQDNRAIFEIPEILAKLLGEPNSSAQAREKTPAAAEPADTSGSSTRELTAPACPGLSINPQNTSLNLFLRSERSVLRPIRIEATAGSHSGYPRCLHVRPRRFMSSPPARRILRSSHNLEQPLPPAPSHNGNSKPRRSSLRWKSAYLLAR